MEYEGLKEPLKSETVVESVCDIDNVFGQYGFKNRAGEFVMEPQYAYAREFTNGLSAVNVCGYTPINLGKIIKEGVLADVPSIHRMTIDRQIKRGNSRE